MGLKQIRGYLRKKTLCLRFLDFPGVLQILRKEAEKAENGRRRLEKADLKEERPDTP